MNRAEPDPKSPIEQADWLARQGSSLGSTLSRLEEQLETGEIAPLACLRELDEEQAGIVIRLARASLSVIRQAATKEEPR